MILLFQSEACLTATPVSVQAWSREVQRAPEASCLKMELRETISGKRGRAGYMQAKEGLQMSLVGGANKGMPATNRGWRREEDK